MQAIFVLKYNLQLNKLDGGRLFECLQPQILCQLLNTYYNVYTTSLSVGMLTCL